VVPIASLVVLGGGFAGLAAVETLASLVEPERIILIDERPASEFLPLLPDVIGKGLAPVILQDKLARVAHRLGIRFLQGRVTAIDAAARTVTTASGNLPFAGLIVATGTRTALPANPAWHSRLLTLDNVADAILIRETAQNDAVEALIVAGAGYTGVETASNLRALARHQRRPPHVVLISRGPELCSGLPLHHRAYLRRELEHQGIDLRLRTTLAAIDQERVTLSDGSQFRSARVIWTGGVGTERWVRSLPWSEGSQGRLTVAANLEVAPGIFAAGDVAAFPTRSGPHRMSVQAALMQGGHAARNLHRHLTGQHLRPYWHFDPGWVVPLAHHHGTGSVLGLPLRGHLPVLLHAFMGLLRTRGVANRLRLLAHLLG
jgi:NADH:ubiquinone reductase (H+-translocating)